MSIYQENGFENRKDYLLSLSEEYGISLEEVLVCAETLGPNEDFDGLISILEDMNY
jgi:hypothetical protein